MKKPEGWLVNLLECLGIKNKTKFKTQNAYFLESWKRQGFITLFFISWLLFGHDDIFWMNTKTKQNKKKSEGIGLGETKQNKKVKKKMRRKSQRIEKKIYQFPNFPNTSGPAESNSICVNV